MRRTITRTRCRSMEAMRRLPTRDLDHGTVSKAEVAEVLDRRETKVVDTAATEAAWTWLAPAMVIWPVDTEADPLSVEQLHLLVTEEKSISRLPPVRWLFFFLCEFCLLSFYSFNEIHTIVVEVSGVFWALDFSEACSSFYIGVVKRTLEIRLLICSLCLIFHNIS